MIHSEKKKLSSKDGEAAAFCIDRYMTRSITRPNVIGLIWQKKGNDGHRKNVFMYISGYFLRCDRRKSLMCASAQQVATHNRPDPIWMMLSAKIHWSSHLSICSACVHKCTLMESLEMCHQIRYMLSACSLTQMRWTKGAPFPTLSFFFSFSLELVVLLPIWQYTRRQCERVF